MNSNGLTFLNSKTIKNDIGTYDCGINHFNTNSDSEISLNDNDNYNDNYNDNDTHSTSSVPDIDFEPNENVNSIHKNGYLKIVVGCMFSGKTSYIIRECKKWQSIGKNVLVINYSLDHRYSEKDMVICHDKYGIDCTMLQSFSDEFNKSILQYDVIIVNEGQFFPDLRKHVLFWCDQMKKIVVVSGLDGDFLRNRFGEILDIIPDSDEVIKLKAYCVSCNDGTDAIFSWKKINNNTSSIDIGGSEKYIPLCRKHYNIEKKTHGSKNM